jgi:tripartite-type tricarboxylate transporter receptor subunit TctC
MRALAILRSHRSSFLPTVPTLSEAGYSRFERAGSDLFFGIVAPPGMSAGLVEKI